MVLFPSGLFGPSLMLAVVLCSAGAAQLPNIVFFITDDQQDFWDLPSLEVMPTVRRLMFDEGIRFENAFVDTPVCCSSRTSTLTGRFVHNLNDRELGWCGNFLEEHLNSTFVTRLAEEAGYMTGLFGKFVNNMGGMCTKQAMIPPGWHTFKAMCNEVTYYNNTFNLNGTIYTTGTDPASYLTAFIGNHTIPWLKQALASERPFFAYVAPHAPHVPATPAPWYWDAPVPQQEAPRLPNWNAASPDKYWMLQEKPPMSDFLINASDTLYRNRLRSLMSVDDLLDDIVDTIDAAGQLDNTYIIYSSDHGYHLGQFRVFMEKREPYEADIRIPLLVRGPGVAQNATSRAMVQNRDLAATILDLAGLDATRTDGRSLKPLLAGPNASKGGDWGRDRVLVEIWGGMNNLTAYQILGPCSPMPPCESDGFPIDASLVDAPSNTYSALRVINASADLMYIEFRPRMATLEPKNTNWTELYNLTADPYQLVNLAGSADRSLLAQLSHELWSLATCFGPDCR